MYSNGEDMGVVVTQLGSALAMKCGGERKEAAVLPLCREPGGLHLVSWENPGWFGLEAQESGEVEPTGPRRAVPQGTAARE